MSPDHQDYFAKKDQWLSEKKDLEETVQLKPVYLGGYLLPCTV